ncbi:hypothetical protein INR49_010081 [Caranx melampygus]|nr:hypothetical protein INR49_010081 [Caranx melampygus]
MFKPSLLVTVGKKKSRRIQEEHEERLGSREVRRSDRGRWRNSLNCLCFSDGATGPSCESIFTERRPGLNTCERHPRSPLELTRVLGPRMMRIRPFAGRGWSISTDVTQGAGPTCDEPLLQLTWYLRGHSDDPVKINLRRGSAPDLRDCPPLQVVQ